MKRNKPETILRKEKKKKKKTSFFPRSKLSKLTAPCIDTRAFIIPSARTEQHSVATLVHPFRGLTLKEGREVPRRLALPVNSLLFIYFHDQIQLRLESLGFSSDW